LERPQAVLQFFLHLEAAQALSRLGQQDKALAEANAAVEKAPDPSRLFCRRIRVQILARAGHLPEALGECQEMLKEYTNPDQVRDIRHTLSMVYSEAHDHTRAEEQLRLLLQADPNDATANNDLGYIWADQGKHLEEAEKLIRKAIDLDRKQRTGPLALETDSDRDNAAYLDSLGWVLFRRGQIEAARRELEKAVALPEGTDDPVVWDHLADVYYRLGEGKLAVAAWRKAIHLYEYVRERPLDERHAEINRKLKLLESKVSRQ
jgi:tetratricopeptide (TPR) repeat protein